MAQTANTKRKLTLVEKRRAEKMVQDWRQASLLALPDYGRYETPQIPVPAVVQRRRRQLAAIVRQLNGDGWGVDMRSPGSVRDPDDLVTVKPLNDHPGVKAVRESRAAARAAIEARARELVRALWADEATFDDVPVIAPATDTRRG